MEFLAFCNGSRSSQTGDTAVSFLHSIDNEGKIFCCSKVIESNPRFERESLSMLMFSIEKHGLNPRDYTFQLQNGDCINYLVKNNYKVGHIDKENKIHKLVHSSAQEARILGIERTHTGDLDSFAAEDICKLTVPYWVVHLQKREKLLRLGTHLLSLGASVKMEEVISLLRKRPNKILFDFEGSYYLRENDVMISFMPTYIKSEWIKQHEQGNTVTISAVRDINDFICNTFASENI